MKKKKYYIPHFLFESLFILSVVNLPPEASPTALTSPPPPEGFAEVASKKLELDPCTEGLDEAIEDVDVDNGLCRCPCLRDLKQ